MGSEGAHQFCGRPWPRVSLPARGEVQVAFIHANQSGLMHRTCDQLRSVYLRAGAPKLPPASGSP